MDEAFYHLDDVLSCKFYWNTTSFADIEEDIFLDPEFNEQNISKYTKVINVIDIVY